MFGVVGVLAASAVSSVLFAYVCTTFLLAQFNVQQRMLIGQTSLPIIVGSNLFSLTLLCAAGSAILSATERDALQMPVAMIAVAAQAIWLTRDLWRYRRDHLRMRYEAYDPIESDTLTES